jgi:hypothetical protein
MGVCIDECERNLSKIKELHKKKKLISTRCKACNFRLTEWDLESTKQDGSPEDMCQKCLYEIFEDND